MQPLYVTLSDRLVAFLQNGVTTVGDSLPSEVDLAKEYGVSRATMRAALQIVQDKGMISRRKRAGIRVESLIPSETFAQSLSTVEDLMRFAVVTERHIKTTEHVVIHKALADRLQIDEGSEWCKLQTLRLDPKRPDHPLCWTEIYLEPKIGPSISAAMHEHNGLVCDLMLKYGGRKIHSVRQEIRAIGVPSRMAADLCCAPESHALEITRHYVDSTAEVFEITVSVFPADRYSYILELDKSL